MFQIDLTDIRSNPGQVFQFTFAENLESLEGEGGKIVFTGPVTVRLSVVYLSGVFWIDGAVQGECVLQCSRCLGEFRHRIDVELHEKYRQGAAQLDDEDAVDETLAGDILNLRNLVKDSILLSLPIKTICREDCRGLCARCGKDLNEEACGCPAEDIDPRLAGLAGLLNPAKKGVE
ncbi:YceD family protein [Desulforudis sp. 1088]|uniref:YceD family protein n=1 Tax=unclassified Candidatus Desulforudis TaxID=2635950 RepID=UPI003CE5295B